MGKSTMSHLRVAWHAETVSRMSLFAMRQVLRQIPEHVVYHMHDTQDLHEGVMRAIAVLSHNARLMPIQTNMDYMLHVQEHLLSRFADIRASTIGMPHIASMWGEETGSLLLDASVVAWHHIEPVTFTQRDAVWNSTHGDNTRNAIYNVARAAAELFDSHVVASTIRQFLFAAPASQHKSPIAIDLPMLAMCAISNSMNTIDKSYLHGWITPLCRYAMAAYTEYRDSIEE